MTVPEATPTDKPVAAIVVNGEPQVMLGSSQATGSRPQEELAAMPERSRLKRLDLGVLGIDLGASYTKVSWRRHPSVAGHFSETTKLLLLNGHCTIPSLAIQTTDPARPWFFGGEAAAINPGPNMKVHYNWKSQLFGLGSDTKYSDALEVAGHFFAWLKKQLELTGLNLSECRARITVPAFEHHDDIEPLLQQCLHSSGWPCPEILIVTEPHANIIGLFAKGTNRATWNRPTGRPQLDYTTMFGDLGPFLFAHRMHAFWGTRGNYIKCMVLDIGAFTTDLAFITMNSDAASEGVSDGVEYLKQTSFRHGIIEDLDRPLFSHLFSRYGLKQSDFSFLKFETMKESIYGGHLYAVTDRIDLGSDEDQAIVAQHLSRFEEQCWAVISAEVLAHKPEWVVLTGGGSLIPRLADFIKRRFQDNHVRPARFDYVGRPLNSISRWQEWNNTAEPLVRVATALGASSIVIDVADFAPNPSMKQDPSTRVHDTRRTESAYVSCTCGGLNPDCDRCYGTGMIRQN